MSQNVEKWSKNHYPESDVESLDELKIVLRHPSATFSIRDIALCRSDRAILY